MKVALLADIHANKGALAAVLREARAADAEQLIVAGDIVGYYYDADAVLRLLDEFTWHGVRGNHEEMLDAWVAGKERETIARKYGSGLSEAHRQLQSTNLERLLALPHPARLVIGRREILVCHGSPWDLNQYIYPDADAATHRRLLAEDCDMVVFGHTHWPVVWREGSTVAVNPGSVGQQRNGILGAAWGLWDSKTNEVELRTTPYDSEPVMHEARTRDPHLPYLAEVLRREKS